MGPLTGRDAAIAACAASAVVHAWLVSVHLDEPLLAASFAAAAVALAAAGLALTRPELGAAPVATAALFAALLIAYPLVAATTDEGYDALGLATKTLEAAGLVAALAARRRRESLGSVDALAGVVVATLLLSLGHGH